MLGRRCRRLPPRGGRAERRPVGSGIGRADGRPRHAIAAWGCHVTLVTKDVLEHANTRFAQGGIAGVMFADDRAEDHVAGHPRSPARG